MEILAGMMREERVVSGAEKKAPHQLNFFPQRIELLLRKILLMRDLDGDGRAATCARQSTIDIN